MVLQLWKQRNEIIHSTSEMTQSSRDQDRLAHRIGKCYEWRDQLRREDREKIFYMEEAELLKEDQRFIKSWLQLAERIIRTVKKEAQRHTNSRKLMESFVQWQKPTNTSRRTPSELQPD
jgi:hypothetical protein